MLQLNIRKHWKTLEFYVMLNKWIVHCDLTCPDESVIPVKHI